MRHLLIGHLVDYATPANLSLAWSWGSLSGLAFVWQLVTGIVLAMHFGVDGVVGLQSGHAAHSISGTAFGEWYNYTDFGQRSLALTMRDVANGHFIRSAHANGASCFFLVVYVHVVRALYYSSWQSPNELVWVIGLAILLLMIITAFIGYVLPWGQMSFWGATVITSLASTVPLLGWTSASKWQLVYCLWGGFAVDSPSVARFYSLHYTLPFIIAGATILHLGTLHRAGSTNPLGISSTGLTLGFYPYFAKEDLLGFVPFLGVLTTLVCFMPDMLGHPDNFIPANPYSTPAHIVPEWYFLWVYAVLRSIPSKTAGVAVIALLFITLGALPLTQLEPRSQSPQFRPLQTIWFWTFLADLLILVWLGAGVIEPSTLLLGQLASLYLLGSTALLMALISALEHDSVKK